MTPNSERFKVVSPMANSRSTCFGAGFSLEKFRSKSNLEKANNIHKIVKKSISVLNKKKLRDFCWLKSQTTTEEEMIIVPSERKQEEKRDLVDCGRNTGKFKLSDFAVQQ